MAEMWQFEMLLGKAIIDPDFARDFVKDPKTAAESVGVKLTEEDLKRINAVVKNVDFAKMRRMLPVTGW